MRQRFSSGRTQWSFFMPNTSRVVELEAIKTRGNGLQDGATDCTEIPTIPVRAARGIWPEKTAENWAAAAGVQPRAVKYWLAGHKVSEAGRLALIRLIA
jgi:hypothetical protein